MTKKTKILFICLLVVIGLLAASTGFFFAKTRNLDSGQTSNSVGKSTKATDTENTATTTNTSNKSANTTTTNTSTANSSVTTPAPLGNRPSSPSDTVTVKQGDTLFSIGQEVGVNWTQIAEANGIDANKIKAGDTLIVPKNNQVGFTVNAEKASTLQKEVDAGKSAFRLSASDTAKSDCSPAYGLSTNDIFTQTKIDETAGSATVSVTKQDKTYIINLVQPVTKGAKGIWAIESIKPSA